MASLGSDASTLGRIYLPLLCFLALWTSAKGYNYEPPQGCMTASEARSQDTASNDYMSLVPLEYSTTQVSFKEKVLYVKFWTDHSSEVSVAFNNDVERASVRRASDGEMTASTIVNFQYTDPSSQRVTVKLMNLDLVILIELQNLADVVDRTCIAFFKINTEPTGDQVYAKGEDLRFRINLGLDSSHRNAHVHLNPFPELLSLETQQSFDPIFYNLLDTEMAHWSRNSFLYVNKVTFSPAMPEYEVFVNTSSYLVTGFLAFEVSLYLAYRNQASVDVSRLVVIKPGGQQGPYPDNFIYFQYLSDLGQGSETMPCGTPTESCWVGCTAVGVGPIQERLYRLPKGPGGERVVVGNTPQYAAAYPFYHNVEVEVIPSQEETENGMAELDFQCEFTNGPGEPITKDIRMVIFDDSTPLEEESTLVRVNDTAMQATCVSRHGSGNTNMTFDVTVNFRSGRYGFMREERITVEPDTVSVTDDRIEATSTQPISRVLSNGATGEAVYFNCRVQQTIPGYEQLLSTGGRTVFQAVPVEWRSP